MRTLSFDWATKKALIFYDSQKEKTKQIPNSIEEFKKFLESLGKEKTIMLFEFGGGDTFKIMAFRAGHTVLQVPGKKIKNYRDSKGLIKDDIVDAKTIYDFYVENGGDVNELMRKSIMALLSSTKNKEERGAMVRVNKNFNCTLPSSFYPFQEQNADIAALKIVFRKHEDLKKDMVREKNKLFAFKQTFKIANVADKEIEKTIFQLEASILGKEKAIEGIKKVLEKKITKFNVWNKSYKDMKGAGATIISGLIGELGGRDFDDDESLKHYCGMVAKKDFNDYNRYVKVILYQFIDQIIRQRTPEWRELYDNMKVYYAKKHPDWSKGKVDNYAKKFIETKLVVDFWGKWRRC